MIVVHKSLVLVTLGAHWWALLSQCRAVSCEVVLGLRQTTLSTW